MDLLKKIPLKKYHSGTIRQSVIVNANSKKVWSKVSNIVGLPGWVKGVKKTGYLSKKRRGVGAKRDITFDDGNKVEEHIVAWNEGVSFSYIALSGLPLKVYVATISIEKNRTKTKITWQSYVLSKLATREKFNEFVSFMNKFYHDSLRTLKEILE